jgi:hypothetical protein
LASKPNKNATLGKDGNQAWLKAVNSLIRERLIIGQRSFIVYTLQKPLQEEEQGVRPAAL